MKHPTFFIWLVFVFPICPIFAQRVLIPKIDLAAPLQKGFTLEVEKQIDNNSSLIFRGAWYRMNRKILYSSPGTYSQSYQVISTESTFWVLFLPVSSTFSLRNVPEPWAPTGGFLPRSAIHFQASIRSYTSKKIKKNRFFIQPGLAILLVNGLRISEQQTFLGKTTTGQTTPQFTGYSSVVNTSSYTQTYTAQTGAKKAAFAMALDCGWRFQGNGKCTLDLGIRSGLNLVKKMIGFKKVYIAPLLNLGFSI